MAKVNEGDRVEFTVDAVYGDKVFVGVAVSGVMRSGYVNIRPDDGQMQRRYENGYIGIRAASVRVIR